VGQKVILRPLADSFALGRRQKEGRERERERERERKGGRVVIGKKYL
jgi:hypothetical protein